MPAMTLCRLCGVLAPDMLSIDADDQLHQQIDSYIPTKIVPIIGLPYTICVRCNAHIQKHATFLDHVTSTASYVERGLKAAIPAKDSNKNKHFGFGRGNVKLLSTTTKLAIQYLWIVTRRLKLTLKRVQEDYLQRHLLGGGEIGVRRPKRVLDFITRNLLTLK